VGARPRDRSNGGIAKIGDRLFITMGHDSVAITADTWAYDLAAGRWDEVAVTGTPFVGSHYGYATDELYSTLVLVGGDDNDHFDVGVTSALILDDAPEFGYLRTSNLLPPRRHTAAAIDPVRRNLLVFGGWQGFGNTLGDTWIHPLGGSP
jgi:hypothetical protein